MCSKQIKPWSELLYPSRFWNWGGLGGGGPFRYNVPSEISDEEEAFKNKSTLVHHIQERSIWLKENYSVSNEDIGFKNAYIFGQNEPKSQTKGLLSKGVFEHLKDKNIREGVRVYIQAGLAEIFVPPSVPFPAGLAPSLTTAPTGRTRSETWSVGGAWCQRALFPFRCPGDSISPPLPRIS